MAKELVVLAKEKYLNLMKQSQEEENQNHLEQSTTSENQKAYERLPESHKLTEVLKMTVPKLLQRKAEALMHFLIQQNVINWNDQGEIVVDGEAIKGSHIIDLIKNVLSRHTVQHPIGYLKFYEVLQSNNTPSAFMINENPRSTKSQQRGKGYVVIQRTKGMPPGLRRRTGNIKKNKKQKTLMKWLTF